MNIIYTLMSFFAVKNYSRFESAVSMPGVALFCCILTAIGLVVMYSILPDTENRSLEEIERHFADDSKKITNRKIAKIYSTSEI